MRKDIQRCFVDNDLSPISVEFLWSLRYSTHCIYSVRNSIVEMDKYIFWQNNQKISDFQIGIKNNIITIDQSAMITDSFENIELDVDLSQQDINLGKLTAYVLSDFLGDKRVVGLLDEYGNCLDHNDNSYLQINEIISQSTSRISKNNLIRVYLDFINGKIVISKELNDSEFRSLRFCGINLALVVIQNLFKRKVTTFKFFDKRQILTENKIERVYFDLDETLIWEGVPIFETRELLNRCVEKSIDIYLITRHKKVIVDTLNSIGIDHKLFVEIIKVEDHQKKSDFIFGSGVFIDNEFPERLDVMLNTKFLAIDVDQVEFLRI